MKRNKASKVQNLGPERPSGMRGQTPEFPLALRLMGINTAADLADFLGSGAQVQVGEDRTVSGVCERGTIFARGGMMRLERR